MTVLRYDAKQRLSEMIVSDHARYDPPTWTFQNATTYQFTAGDVTGTLVSPTLSVDIGERPGEMAKRNLEANDPENLSRSEIKSALELGTLSDPQRRLFSATYAAKLARPFSAFVFVVFALSARDPPHPGERRRAWFRPRARDRVRVLRDRHDLA